jgi:hypothetical protein
VVLDRLDFLLRLRLGKAPAICGAAFLGTLALSLLLFLLIGNGLVQRTLFFPSLSGRRLLAEQRFVPRQGSLERDVGEVVAGVLLGPARPDAQRVFPRGATVQAVMASGRTLYVDLTPAVLAQDTEIPLKGRAALDALARTIRFDFPRFRDVVILIDGQSPRFNGK